MMTSSIFQEIKKGLNKGILEKGHPFRYGTLAHYNRWAAALKILKLLNI